MQVCMYACICMYVFACMYVQFMSAELLPPTHVPAYLPDYLSYYGKQTQAQA